MKTAKANPKSSRHCLREAERSLLWRPQDPSADKMLHARVVAVLAVSEYLPDGLLIASDTQSKRSLFHFTAAEIASVLDVFLKDEVRLMQNGLVDVEVHGTSKIFAIRSEDASTTITNGRHHSSHSNLCLRWFSCL